MAKPSVSSWAAAESSAVGDAAAARRTGAEALAIGRQTNGHIGHLGGYREIAVDDAIAIGVDPGALELIHSASCGAGG